MADSDPGYALGKGAPFRRPRNSVSIVRWARTPDRLQANMLHANLGKCVAHEAPAYSRWTIDSDDGDALEKRARFMQESKYCGQGNLDGDTYFCHFGGRRSRFDSAILSCQLLARNPMCFLPRRCWALLSDPSRSISRRTDLP